MFYFAKHQQWCDKKATERIKISKGNNTKAVKNHVTKNQSCYTPNYSSRINTKHWIRKCFMSEMGLRCEAFSAAGGSAVGGMSVKIKSWSGYSQSVSIAVYDQSADLDTEYLTAWFCENVECTPGFFVWIIRRRSVTITVNRADISDKFKRNKKTCRGKKSRAGKNKR